MDKMEALLNESLEEPLGPLGQPEPSKEAEQAETVEEMHLIYLLSSLKSQACSNLHIRVVTYSLGVRHIQNLALHDIKFEN